MIRIWIGIIMYLIVLGGTLFGLVCAFGWKPILLVCALILASTLVTVWICIAGRLITKGLNE